MSQRYEVRYIDKTTPDLPLVIVVVRPSAQYIRREFAAAGLTATFIRELKT